MHKLYNFIFIDIDGCFNKQFSKEKDYLQSDRFGLCQELVNNLKTVLNTVDNCKKNISDCSSLTLPATQLASRCYSSMFQSCTSLTAAPELPATQLAYSCYSNMFSYCTSLTAAPELPATQLADYCYYSMFFGCQRLKISDTEVANGTKILDIPVGTEAKTNWNAGMFFATGGTFKGDPEIGKAYWQY